MMTEVEAKKRWCPFVRFLTYGDGDSMCAINRGGDPVVRDACNCIASACMAWRWQDRTDGVENPKGYCGLAGRPE